MYKVNEYLVFNTEMQALKEWLQYLHRIAAPNKLITSKLFTNFMQEHFNMDLSEIVFSRIVPMNMSEKIKYLANLGLNKNEITKVTGKYHYTVDKTLREDNNVRYYQPNEEMDKLMEQWEKVRPLIPNEIFINYLKG